MRHLLIFLLINGLIINVSLAQMMVSGTITSSEDNLGVIGATVQVKDGAEGAITDIDGKYSLKVPDENATLIISYIGMEEQEIPVSGRTQIDVLMQPSSSLLDEVIVVGYSTQKRSEISGAVSVVTAEEISSSPVLRVEQALQGRTAGVQVAQNSGSPGAALSVRIRGTGTLGNGEPLYIVDGIAVGGLDFLNPNDIESISVLKDGASTAIYGSRGANGVVLITTKGGTKGQPGEVTYTSYYGIQNPARKLKLLNAREYAIIQNESYIAAGRVPLAEFTNPDALGEGTDWQDAIFQSAPIINHQLGFSGGSEKSTYTLAGNYFLQDGIIGGNKASFKRYTARLNATHDVKDWLTVGNVLGFTNLTRDALSENNEFNSPLIRALNMDPVTPVRKADGTYAYSVYSDTDITNPVNAIEQTFDSWTTNRVVGAAFVEARPLRGLSIRSTYSLDATFATQDIFRPRFDLSNDPVLSDAPAQEKSLMNSVSFGNNVWKNWQWENVVSWTESLGDKHNLTTIIGNTMLAARHDYNGGSNTNLPSNDPEDAYIQNTIDPIESQGTYQGASENALLSYFGRMDYNFADKYLAGITLRADGSSRFGENNRYGIFPSASAGWVISREDFFKFEPITFLKLRASWGQNGTDAAGNDYPSVPIVTPGQSYVFGPNETITNGSVAITAGNEDVKWETSVQSDVGIDVEFWSGKLNLTADYFIKTTKDMLFTAPIPTHVGAGAPVRNVATMNNKGWELALNYRNKAGGFSYDVGGNVTFIKNEVTGLGEGGEPLTAGYIQSANSQSNRTDVGQTVGSFYGYVTDGLFQNAEEVAAHATQSENTAPGDIRFKDLNGDNVINADDRTYIGNPIPDFTYGFTGNFEYKGIDLQMFLQGVHGNEIYNGTVRYDFIFVNRPASVLERWTGEGTSNSEPRVNINDPNQNARISDRFIESGSYLRLKNIQVGYDLAELLPANIRVQKIRLYLAAQNLITFTKYSGLDPEIGNINPNNSLELGIDRGFYPQARTILGGIQVTF